VGDQPYSRSGDDSLAQKRKTYNPRKARPKRVDRFRGRVTKGQGAFLAKEYVEDGFNLFSDRIQLNSTRDGQQRDGGIYDDSVNHAKQGVGWLALGEGGNVWLDTEIRQRDMVPIDDVVVTPYIPKLDLDYDYDVDPLPNINIPTVDGSSYPNLPAQGGMTGPRPISAVSRPPQPLPDRPPSGGTPSQTCTFTLEEIPMRLKREPVVYMAPWSNLAITTGCWAEGYTPTGEEGTGVSVSSLIASTPPSWVTALPYNPASSYPRTTTDYSYNTPVGGSSPNCGSGIYLNKPKKWVSQVGFSQYYAFVGAYCYEAVSAIPLSPFDKIYAQASYPDGGRGPLTPVSSSNGGSRFCAAGSNHPEEGIPLGSTEYAGGGPQVRFYRESVNCITSIPLSSL